MDALDLRRIERAAGVADQHRTRHFQRRHRLIAAFDHGARTARDDLAALQQALDVGVILVLLESLERFEARVFIVQADHESDVHSIVVEVVKKTSAIRMAVERPTQGVLNEAGLDTSGRQLPQLLESQSIGLRRLAGIEVEPLDQLLRDAAAASLAEHGDLGVNLGPQREIRSGLAILFNAHVADAYAFDGARVVKQGFRRRKSSEYVHPQFLGFLPQNGYQLSQRDDEVAVIRHLRRGRQPEAFAASHEQELIARGRHADRRAVTAPIWKQIIE